MSKFRFIDRPISLHRSLYDEAVDGIIERNKDLPGLKAIIQFGNITTPGISDLDILFVFQKGIKCRKTGLEELPEEHSALFTHGIMAISEDQYADNEYYTLWSEHRVIWGNNSLPESKIRTQEEDRSLKIQTAVEFLIANYIDLKIQKTYSIIKLRSLLQHMKGILYDLDYLEDENSILHPHLEKLKAMIVAWFSETPSDRIMSDWYNSFEILYDEYVHQTLKKHPMYLPGRDQFAISKNMLLQNSSTVNFTHQGILLPSFLSFSGRYYVKLQHRFNKFIIACPLRHEASKIVEDRFEFLIRVKEYNRQYLPNFMTMTTSITAKLI